MKIKAIFAAIAVAAVALLAASCSKTDTGANAGGYYVRANTTEAYDATINMQFNTALKEVFGDGIVYRNATNDQKAIAACDEVWEKNKASSKYDYILYFQAAAEDASKAPKTTVKEYKR